MSESKNESTFGKDQWVELFRTAGMDDEMMTRWHREFERTAPEAHQSFLEWLAIPAAEIEAIRDRYRSPGA